jgi:hypothetical protein
VTPPGQKFFIHVMKSGGTTLRQHIRRNFEPDEVYPWKELDRDLILANTQIDHLTALPPAPRPHPGLHRSLPVRGRRAARRRCDHQVDAITLTTLWDPVERATSYLRATGATRMRIATIRCIAFRLSTPPVCGRSSSARSAVATGECAGPAQSQEATTSTPAPRRRADRAAQQRRLSAAGAACVVAIEPEV